MTAIKTPKPTTQPRLGFCCKYLPDVPPGHYETKKAAQEALLAVNVTSVTMAYLGRLSPKERRAKLEKVIDHNLTALAWQVDWVAKRPPLERLLRMASSLMPGYTHPVAQGFYAEPGLSRTIRNGLAKIGEAARAGGVRLSMHPGPFCILASRNPAAEENGIAEFEYHAEIMAMMGYGSGWHPHGAHLNIHVGARDPGIDGFRAGLARISETARNLVTVENDENCFGLDTVLKLADVVPVVLDLHHHWVQSRGAYITPDDPRIALVRQSWRGVRPLAHISVSRESVVEDHDIHTRPDFEALIAQGHSWRDLAAHSDLMWNRAVNDLVAQHLAWADFEIEAKSKNLASVGLAAQIGVQEHLREAA